MHNESDVLKNIFNETIVRYTNRFKSYNYDVRTLGWGSVDQQYYRFVQTISSGFDFTNKSILDIGCGFGDYYNFLQEERINVGSYEGWDINQDLIGEAKRRYEQESNVVFRVNNIFETKREVISDIGVMLGVLNFNLKDSYDNYKYSKIVIKNALELVNDLLIVDFLSTNLDKSYPKEDFVFYHRPDEMLNYAFSLSQNIVLKHNYAPIPQKEFMLFIFK